VERAVNRRQSIITVLLVLMFGTIATLGAVRLPDMTTAIGHTINPIILVDAISAKVLLSNHTAQQLYATDASALEGAPLDTILDLRSASITDLHGTVTTLGDPPTHYLISVLHFAEGSRAYYTIMLQNWEHQYQSTVRNRLLLTLSFTLLAVSLVILFILLRTQSRLLKRFREHQRSQEATLALFQQFLDTDQRLSNVRDSEGRFIFVNAAFEHYSGISRHELAESTLHTFNDRELAHQMLADDRRILETGEPIDTIRHHNGRVYHIFMFPLLLPDGSPGIGTLVSDITEEQQVEEVLRENLSRSALLAELLSSTHAADPDHLDRGLEHACTLTDSAAALLLLYNEEEGVLTIAGSCRLQSPCTELSRATTTYLLDRIIGARALIENRNPEANPLARVMGLNLHSLLTVPFYAEQRLGGIVLLSNSPLGYTDQDGYQVQLLFSALYTSVQNAHRDLQLQESRASLRLILDSTAEGIFGIDEEGRCTFANASSLALLGYTDESELLGKNIHAMIHAKRRDGSSLKPTECSITNTIIDGTGIVMEDEVFWRSDGSFFDVLAYAYPQKRDGRTIGAVVTFTDNTERKQARDHIEYLSLHDQLTGLYNRAYFDQALAHAQREAVLPYSIIVGDVNGLKLTNDIFGHSAGDALLIDIANTLLAHCPETAIISRIGGDEFVILLPHHTEVQTDLIGSAILESLDRQTIFAGRQAIALGTATRHSIEEPIHEVFDRAEDQMYQQKVLRLRETQRHQLEMLTRILFEKAPAEESHAKRVQERAVAIGATLGLDAENLSLLGRAGYYHDIGKLVLDAQLITSKGSDASRRRAYQSHVSAGYRILNTFEETMDLAPYVLHHHEWYNGAGYLKGLNGKEIPYLSRVLRLAEIWEREDLDNKSIEQIITILSGVSGVEADPQMVARILASL